MTCELVVIGGGNMGAALVGGMLASGTAQPGVLAVVEPLEARRQELAAMFPLVTIERTVPECRSAVIAVKPPDVPEVVAVAAAAGATRLLSIAAGVTTTAIERAAGEGVAVVRAMPNTPALVGQGVSGLAAGRGASADDLEWAAAILRGVGTVAQVDESQLDAVTGLTGSGPAYVFMVAEALIEAGERVGLRGDLVEAMVAQLLVGSAALLQRDGDAAGLRVKVTSPGGTTAAGLRVLEERSVRDAFVEAVEAATARSRELGAE